METKEIDFVFDGPPGPVAGRFVEAETLTGQGVRVGEWHERPDGNWALRVAVALPPVAPAGPGVGLSEATRRIAGLRDSLQSEHVRHLMEVQGLERAIAKATADRDLVLGGMTLDVVALAESVIEVKGREHVGVGDGRAVVADAIRDLATGAQKLRTVAFATKNFDRWSGQREDHQYGHGPRHGSIVFSVGLLASVRVTSGKSLGRPLTEAETDAAIAYLHAILGTLARP